MCVLFYKKSRNCCISIFDECDKKLIKHFATKSFRVFKGAIFGIFERKKKKIPQKPLGGGAADGSGEG